MPVAPQKREEIGVNRIWMQASEHRELRDTFHGEVKRQRVAVVESTLANIDVVSQLAAFLEAKDLCQVKATSKALGSANDGAAFNGLSITEEAARRLYEGASDKEKAMLPRYEGEGWIELYHHLLMLRSRLAFDQLLGRHIEYIMATRQLCTEQTNASTVLVEAMQYVAIIL